MGKFLTFVIVVYILYYLFRGDKKNIQGGAQHSGNDSLKGEDMVLDPHCQTYVAKDDAYRIRSGDDVYYFCSTECREKYLKEKGSGL